MPTLLNRHPHHAELYRKTLKPGLTRGELAELSSHCYAAWRSQHEGTVIHLFGLDVAGCDRTFYVRNEAQNAASREPIHTSSLVGTYVDGRATFRAESPMTAHLDAALDGILAPEACSC